MKVFVVTEGDYSDYSIYAVCSTREKAEQVCKAMQEENKHPDPQIEEWELDEVPTRLEKGLFVFGLSWVDDLKEFNVWRADLSCKPTCIDKRETIIDGKYVYFLFVEARNIEHAKKIALEKFIQFKAGN